MSKIRIFLIDENSISLKNRSSFLGNYGYDCSTFPEETSAIVAVPIFRPEIVIYKGTEVIDFLSQIHKINENILVIVLSENNSVDFAVNTVKKGAFDYISLPFSNKRLLQTLHQAKRQLLTKHTLNSKSYNDQIVEFCGMVGRSDAIQHIFSKIKKIAKTNANVLVLGESGTGKELLARAIHRNSNRSQNQFIPVSCSALPNSLLESELFGYEKGAFTGAQTPKIGLIELAEKGTLFLDEITEIDMEIQPKLLRFLQDFKIRRLGGLNEIEVNTRLISACNSDPYELISQNKFREDLFYRLDVIRFTLPPLRDRKEDIPLLVNYFINKYNKQIENRIVGIDEFALKLLIDFHWPGNIRQLENVIERSVIITEDEHITLHNLPNYIREYETENKIELSFNKSFKELRKEYLEQFEKKYIRDLLKKHEGNISQAAREAGINRRTIYRMIDLHDISHKI